MYEEKTFFFFKLILELQNEPYAFERMATILNVFRNWIFEYNVFAEVCIIFRVLHIHSPGTREFSKIVKLYLFLILYFLWNISEIVPVYHYKKKRLSTDNLIKNRVVIERVLP